MKKRQAHLARLANSPQRYGNQVLLKLISQKGILCAFLFLLAVPHAIAGIREDFNKLLRCTSANLTVVTYMDSLPDIDLTCVGQEQNLYERFVYHADSDAQWKMFAADALYQLYRQRGEEAEAQRIAERKAALKGVIQAEKAIALPYCSYSATSGQVMLPNFPYPLRAGSCESFIDSIPEGPLVISMPLNVEGEMATAAAEYLKTLGKDYQQDQKYYRKMAHLDSGLPSVAERIAGAISAGTTAYQASRGYVQVQPTSVQQPIATTSVQNVNVNGSCTEVHPYMVVKIKAVRDLTAPDPIEVFPSFENHYGETVTCAYHVHHDGAYGSDSGYEYSVDPGKTASLGIVGIPSDNGEIEWACFPKRQQDANYCLGQVKWTP